MLTSATPGSATEGKLALRPAELSTVSPASATGLILYPLTVDINQPARPLEVGRFVRSGWGAFSARSLHLGGERPAIRFQPDAWTTLETRRSRFELSTLHPLPATSAATEFAPASEMHARQIGRFARLSGGFRPSAGPREV